MKGERNGEVVGSPMLTARPGVARASQGDAEGTLRLPAGVRPFPAGGWLGLAWLSRRGGRAPNCIRAGCRRMLRWPDGWRQGASLGAKRRRGFYLLSAANSSRVRPSFSGGLCGPKIAGREKVDCGELSQAFGSTMRPRERALPSGDVGIGLESDEGMHRVTILSEELHMLFLKPYLWFSAKREDGQTMAEYAVVLGVITLAVVGVFTALAGGISGAIDSVKGAI